MTQRRVTPWAAIGPPLLGAGLFALLIIAAGLGAVPAIAGGFGLFFVGIRLIGEHTQQLATRRVRQHLGKVLTRSGAAPLAGFTLGALVQSTSGVTFLTVGLVTSGLLAVAPSMSLLAWSNVGTSVLVVLSSFDLRTMALYLVGLHGLMHFAGRTKATRTKHVASALLGVGLVFLGLSLVREGVDGVSHQPWAEQMVASAARSGIVSFLIGVVAAIAAQSSATVTILALPLVNAGIIHETQMTLMVYGASVGSGVSVMLMSSHFDGTARQLAMFQSVLKLLGVAVFVPLYYIEHLWHIPLVEAGARMLADAPASRAAVIYVTFQIGAAILGQAFRGPLCRILAALSPPTAEETVMRPHYVFAEAAGDANTALTLVEREQARLIAALPLYLDAVRPESERSPDALPLSTRHAASSAVAAEIEGFLTQVVESNPAYDDVEALFEARSALHALRTLQNCLHDFAHHVESVPEISGHPLTGNLVESLHLLLTTVVEVSQTGNRDDRAMLDVLTSDRSDVMNGLRKRLISEPGSAAQRQSLLVATMLFERSVWLVRGLPLPIVDQPSAVPATAETATEAQAAYGHKADEKPVS